MRTNDFIKAGVKLRNRPKIYVKISVSVKFQSASYTYAKHTRFNIVATYKPVPKIYKHSRGTRSHMHIDMNTRDIIPFSVPRRIVK